MRTVERVTRLLEHLSEMGEAGVSELARRIGADKSVVYRILKTLGKSEWVEQNPQSRLYRIGPALSDLRSRIPSRADVVAVAGPILDQLVDDLDETAFLSGRQGAFNVIEMIRESRQEVRVVSEIGRRIPLHGGAAGKVLLAFERQSVRERMLATDLAAFTSTTITNPEKLQAELTEIRRRGWGYDEGETTPGVCGLAAPLLLHGQNLVGCVSVRAPASRLSFSQAERAAPLVVSAAARLAKEIEKGRSG